MERSILISAMTIGLVAVMVSAGTIAYFNDTETSEGNTFTAGTLDLKVDGQDDPNVVSVSLSDMKPGDSTGYYKWVLKNVGTLSGKLSATFSVIINNDNGLTEPESAVDNTGGSGEGELGQYLKPTRGWGPPGWSVPSKLQSQWQSGPPHPWGVPGLNGFGGTTYTYGVLGPGSEIALFLKLDLDSNLRIWDGTKWIEVVDDIIQSDTVEFDITFKLEQV